MRKVLGQHEFSNESFEGSRKFNCIFITNKLSSLFIGILFVIYGDEGQDEPRQSIVSFADQPRLSTADSVKSKAESNKVPYANSSKVFIQARTASLEGIAEDSEEEQEDDHTQPHLD